MRIKYNTELVSGGVFAIVSAVLWFMINSQIKTMETTAINAKSVPSLVIGAMFIFSTALFIQGIIRPKKEVVINSEFFATDSVKKELRTILFCLMLLVYALLFNIIGFIIGSCILVSAILFYYHCRKWWYYAIVIAAVFVVYFVFTRFLNVDLPTLFL